MEERRQDDHSQQRQQLASDFRAAVAPDDDQRRHAVQPFVDRAVELQGFDDTVGERAGANLVEPLADAVGDDLGLCSEVVQHHVGDRDDGRQRAERGRHQRSDVADPALQRALDGQRDQRQAHGGEGEPDRLLHAGDEDSGRHGGDADNHEPRQGRDAHRSFRALVLVNYHRTANCPWPGEYPPAFVAQTVR